MNRIATLVLTLAAAVFAAGSASAAPAPKIGDAAPAVEQVRYRGFGIYYGPPRYYSYGYYNGYYPYGYRPYRYGYGYGPYYSGRRYGYGPRHGRRWAQERFEHPLGRR